MSEKKTIQVTQYGNMILDISPELLQDYKKQGYRLLTEKEKLKHKPIEKSNYKTDKKTKKNNE